MDDVRPSRGWRAVVAAVGSVLSAWVAVDALLNSGATSGTATDHAFLWLWGAPFAVASLYLGWLAITGHRLETWKRARLGCLGAASTGGAAFIAFFITGTLGDSRILTGIVEGLRWSPAAATVGLIVTTLLTEKRGRRSRERRPPDS